MHIILNFTFCKPSVLCLIFKVRSHFLKLSSQVKLLLNSLQMFKALQNSLLFFHLPVTFYSDQQTN